MDINRNFNKYRSIFLRIIIPMMPILIVSCNSELFTTSTRLTEIMPIATFTSPSQRINPIITSTLTLSPTIIHSPSQASTSTVNPFDWKYIGPDGGDISGLSIDPINPSIVYASTEVGLFKSKDNGDNWNKIGEFWGSEINIDPITPSTIYVNSTAYIHKSTDGGVTWKILRGPNGLNISGDLSIDPLSPFVLYTVSGTGVKKSTNGGEDWFLIGLENAGLNKIIIDPHTPTTIYVGGGGGKIYKSIDGGNNWNELKPIPVSSKSAELDDFAIDPVAPTTLYTAIRGNGIFKSTNGGESWRAISPDLKTTLISSIVIDPERPMILYVGTREGIYKSSNGGVTWRALETSIKFGDIRFIVIDPINIDYLYAGTKGGGVVRSINAGEEWFALNKGIPNNRAVLSMEISQTSPITMYVGIDARGVFKSTDGGNSWINIMTGYGQYYDIAIDPLTPSTIYIGSGNMIQKSTNDVKELTTLYFGATVYAIAIDPITPSIMYAGINNTIKDYGGELLKSTNGGKSWIVLKTGIDDRNSVQDIVINPTKPSTLYAGTVNGIFISTNGGNDWIASTVSKNNAVLSLAIDPLTPTTLYAGTWDEGIFKSIDGGMTWNAINIGIRDIGKISDIVVNPTTPTTLYFCVIGPSTNNSILGVYESLDGGENWSSIGLDYLEVYSLGIDPNTPTTIYAGTANGVYSLKQSATS